MEKEDNKDHNHITPMWVMDNGETYDIRSVDGNSKPGEPPWRVSKFPSAMEMNHLARGLHNTSGNNSNKEGKPMYVPSYMGTSFMNGNNGRFDDLDVEKSMKDASEDEGDDAEEIEVSWCERV